MELKYSTVTRKGRISIITLDRPDSHNALHPPAHLELAQVFDEFAHDPEQWVGIVTGSGMKAFSAGKDLKWEVAPGQEGEIPESFGDVSDRFDCPKPIIAAVNGFAMGAGFEMALACDLIVAAENAIFALSEPRFGTAALPRGVLLLTQQIGLKRAMGMILTGRRVSAHEGYELGFVNEVVPQGEALAAAERWAETICENSPMSIRASKQAIQRGLGRPIEEAISEQSNYPAVKAMFASTDFIEGPRAFAEKRKPNWSGK